MKTVTVHSKAGCPFCDKAKSFLETRGIEFVEVSHDDDNERNAFYNSLGLVGRERTVPQVIIDEERVGGFVELLAHFKKLGTNA